jgi:hypothetical protein
MLKDGSNKHNLELSMLKVKATQLGIFDKNILCANCDGILGQLDDNPYNVIRDFDLSRCLGVENVFTDQSVVCERFCKGILAILWRASISHRYPYSNVSLGARELIVRDIVFGLRPLGDFTDLEIVIQYYRSSYFDDKVRFFYTLPQHNSFEGLSGYSFALNGFRISIKTDQRNFPSNYAPFILNRHKVFRGLVVELEQTTEFRRMTEIAAADEMRRSRATATRRRRG